MKVKKLPDIRDLNKLPLLDYQLHAIDEETLIIIGDNGNRFDLRVEIKFLGVAYIACPLYIDVPILWERLAEDEAREIVRLYDDPYHISVFRIREDFSVFLNPPQREPRTFYIASSRVDITLSYHEDRKMVGFDE